MEVLPVAYEINNLNVDNNNIANVFVINTNGEENCVNCEPFQIVEIAQPQLQLISDTIIYDDGCNRRVKMLFIRRLIQVIVGIILCIFLLSYLFNNYR